jgi:hypothetical protein
VYTGNLWRGLLVAILLIVVLGGIGSYAYSLGIAQGAVARGEAPSAVAPYAYGYPFYRPFGFGFGFLGCLFPLFFFLIFFAVLRAIFWGGHWGRHHHGEHGVPHMFEEWHKRAHESETKQTG